MEDTTPGPVREKQRSRRNFLIGLAVALGSGAIWKIWDWQHKQQIENRVGRREINLGDGEREIRAMHLPITEVVAEEGIEVSVLEIGKVLDKKKMFSEENFPLQEAKYTSPQIIRPPEGPVYKDNEKLRDDILKKFKGKKERAYAAYVIEKEDKSGWDNIECFVQCWVKPEDSEVFDSGEPKLFAYTKGGYLQELSGIPEEGHPYVVRAYQTGLVAGFANKEGNTGYNGNEIWGKAKQPEKKTGVYFYSLGEKKGYTRIGDWDCRVVDEYRYYSMPTTDRMGSFFVKGSHIFSAGIIHPDDVQEQYQEEIKPWVWRMDVDGHVERNRIPLKNGEENLVGYFVAGESQIVRIYRADQTLHLLGMNGEEYGVVEKVNGEEQLVAGRSPDGKILLLIVDREQGDLQWGMRSVLIEEQKEKVMVNEEKYVMQEMNDVSGIYDQLDFVRVSGDQPPHPKTSVWSVRASLHIYESVWKGEIGKIMKEKFIPQTKPATNEQEQYNMHLLDMEA